MEWKENFRMEYGIVKVWNEMQRIFCTSIHFPYLFILIPSVAFLQVRKINIKINKK